MGKNGAAYFCSYNIRKFNELNQECSRRSNAPRIPQPNRSSTLYRNKSRMSIAQLAETFFIEINEQPSIIRRYLEKKNEAFGFNTLDDRCSNQMQTGYVRYDYMEQTTISNLSRVLFIPTAYILHTLNSVLDIF